MICRRAAGRNMTRAGATSRMPLKKLVEARNRGGGGGGGGLGGGWGGGGLGGGLGGGAAAGGGGWVWLGLWGWGGVGGGLWGWGGGGLLDSQAGRLHYFAMRNESVFPGNETAGAKHCRLPPSLICTCRRHGVIPTRFVIVVKIATQTTSLLEQARFEGFRRCEDASTPVSFPRNVRASLRRLLPVGCSTSLLGGSAAKGALVSDYILLKQHRCSTSKFGVGQVENSKCTPLGLHKVS